MACIDVNEPSDEWMMNFKGFETIEKYRQYMNSLSEKERNHQLHWGIYNFNGFLKEDHKCRSGQEVMNRWCRACKLVFRSTRSFDEHVKTFHRAPANDNFDLGKLCDFLPNDHKKISYQDWLKISRFIVKQKLDIQICADYLDKRWNCNGNEQGKTLKLMEDFKQKQQFDPILIGNGAIVNIMKHYSESKITMKEIQQVFPRKKYSCFNELRQFNCAYRKMFFLYEIENFFLDVVKFTWGKGSQFFVWREEYKINIGTDEITQLDIVTTANNPFEKLRNFVVKIKPSHKSLKDICDNDPDFAGSTENYWDCFNHMKPKETKQPTAKPHVLITTVSQVFEDMMMYGKMEQNAFRTFNVFPYCYEEQEVNVPSDVYNCWIPFHLANLPEAKCYLEDTSIYIWMKEVLCNNCPKKLKYLENYLATRIQQPWKKVGKMLIFYATKKGVGKTSFLHFARALFGKDKIAYCSTVKQLLSQQNSRFVGKLFIFIDDINRQTERVSNELKDLITGDTLVVKELYKDPVDVKVFFELMCTSNFKCPLYVDSENRRYETIVVSDTKKHEKEFWDLFYSELEDLTTMKAWFDYFANYEITMHVDTPSVRFDYEELSRMKLECMKIAHQFVCDIFEEKDWYSHHGLVVNDILYTVLDEKNIAVSTKTMFDVFKQWLKATGRKNAIVKKNFLTQLEELDIERKRKEIGTSRPNCCFINADDVERNIRKLYSENFILEWQPFEKYVSPIEL